MIDFVKIGEKAMSPEVGVPKIEKQMAVSEETKSAPSSAEKAEEVKKQEVEKEKVDLKPQKIVPDKKPEVKKPEIKKEIKKPEVKKPAVPSNSKNSANSNKTTAKTGEKKDAVKKAKVDLTKKITSEKSVADLLNKQMGNGSKKAGMSESYAEELTGTEIDLLNNHMRKFWNIPSGHERINEIDVEIELFISAEGVVEKAKIVDQKRFFSDSAFRIVAESALRAVLDPECSPLPLNKSKYNQWKHMIFVFDPKSMCGL